MDVDRILDLLDQYLPRSLVAVLAFGFNTLTALVPDDHSTLQSWLPLVISLCAIYWTISSALRTASFAFRSIVFLLKYGAVFAIASTLWTFVQDPPMCRQPSAASLVTRRHVHHARAHTRLASLAHGRTSRNKDNGAQSTRCIRSTRQTSTRGDRWSKGSWRLSSTPSHDSLKSAQCLACSESLPTRKTAERSGEKKLKARAHDRVLASTGSFKTRLKLYP